MIHDQAPGQYPCVSYTSLMYTKQHHKAFKTRNYYHCNGDAALVHMRKSCIVNFALHNHG